MIKKNKVFTCILILAIVSFAMCGDDDVTGAAPKNDNDISRINIQCHCTHTSVTEKCCCCTRNETCERYQNNAENAGRGFYLSNSCIRCSEGAALHIGRIIILKYMPLDKIRQTSEQFICFLFKNNTAFMPETDIFPPKKPPRVFTYTIASV